METPSLTEVEEEGNPPKKERYPKTTESIYKFLEPKSNTFVLLLVRLAGFERHL